MILRSTWNPARREIKQEQLGHLSVGSLADVAVLGFEKGDFGFLDMFGARMPGTQKLTCEMTLRDGRIAYELNGLPQAGLGRVPQGLSSDWRRALGMESRPRPEGIQPGSLT